MKLQAIAFDTVLYAVPYFLNARMFEVWHDLINFRHCIQHLYKRNLTQD